MMNDGSKNEQQPPGAFESLEQSAGWMLLVVHAWACSLYVFTRRGFGRDFFGVATLASVPILLMLASMSQSNSELALFKALSVAWILSVGLHRIQLLWKPHTVGRHSRYNGWPILCDVLPIDESIVKMLWEPAVIGALGVMAHCVSMSAFGAYLMLGAAACFIDGWVIEHRMFRRTVQIEDADIEHRVMLSKSQGRYSKR